MNNERKMADSDDDTREHKQSNDHDDELRNVRMLLDEARKKLDHEREKRERYDEAARKERKNHERAIRKLLTKGERERENARQEREKLEEALQQERVKYHETIQHAQETIQQHTQTIQTMAGTQKAMADGFNHIAKMGLKMLNTRKIEDRPTVEKAKQFLLENEKNTPGCQIAFSSVDGELRFIVVEGTKAEVEQFMKTARIGARPLSGSISPRRPYSPIGQFINTATPPKVRATITQEVNALHDRKRKECTDDNKVGSISLSKRIKL